MNSFDGVKVDDELRWEQVERYLFRDNDVMIITELMRMIGQCSHRASIRYLASLMVRLVHQLFLLYQLNKTGR